MPIDFASQAGAGRLAVLALILTCGAATAAEPTAASRAVLGVHLYGSDSDGAPLRDKVLAGEDVDLGDCEDTLKPKGAADETAQPPRATAPSGRAAEIRKSGPLVDIENRDLWARAKFRCIVKDALGRQSGEWRKAGKRRLDLVFLFNGGLNSQRQVTNLARGNFERILAEQKFPIYMIWPTGGLDAYGENLLDVRSGDRIGRNPLNLLTAVTQFAADGLKGVGGLPKTMENGVRYYVDLKEPEIVGDLPERADIRDGVVAAGRNVSHSSKVDEPDGRPYVPPPTVALRPATMALSDIGLAAWNNMVRRTRTSIHATAEFPPRFPIESGASPGKERCDQAFPEASDPSFNLRRCYPSGAGAFSRFFHWYLACVDPRLVPQTSDQCPLALGPEDRKALREARFSFVGHSMGAIVINELIASYPSLPFENLVFMAGADSVRSTRKTLAPLVARNGGCTRFYNLMLHPKNDANERMAFGVIPKGSLLEYIDHYLDPAKTIDDRTIGKWVNVRATRHMFSPAAQTWTVHQIYDLRSRAIPREPPPEPDGVGTPTKHGDFNNAGVPFWSERFWNPQNLRFRPAAKDCDGKFFTPA